MKIKNFNPKKDHGQRKEFGILAEPLSKPVETKDFWGVKMAKIHKKNLGIGKYQRPTEDRIEKIRAKWHKDFGTANVTEVQHKGKFYYQIVDGQQRSCASPDEFMRCIVTNGQFPVDNFLMANDKDLVKPVSVDQIFWALINKYDTVDKSDEKQVKFVFDIFENHGLTPQSETNKSISNDFGTNVARIHKYYINCIVNPILKKQDKVKSHKIKSEKVKKDGKKRKQSIQVVEMMKKYGYLADMNENQIKELCQKVFVDTMDIMFAVFGKDTFTSRKKYVFSWIGLMEFLAYWGWNSYSKQDIITSLQTGRWCKFGRGQEREFPLSSISEWNQAQREYFPEIDRKATQWMQLFVDVYRVSKRP